MTDQPAPETETFPPTEGYDPSAPVSASAPAVDATLAAAEVDVTPTQAATPQAGSITPPPVPASVPSVPLSDLISANLTAQDNPTPTAQEAPAVSLLTPPPMTRGGVSPSLSVTSSAAPSLSPASVSAAITAQLSAKDQRQITLGNVGVPTQVANPRRTAWRTVIQSIIGLLIVAVPLANAVLANLADYLKTQHDLEVAPWVYIAVNGGIAISAFVIGLVARIMAVPGVAAFIENYLPFLAPIKTGGKHGA